MKGIVTDKTQLDDDTIKYTISNNGFVNRMRCPVRNLARYGSTILDGLKNLDRHLPEIHPGDKIVLEFGGNDCNFDWKAIAEDPTGDYEPSVTLTQFGKLYEQIIDKIRQAGATPVLLSLPALLPQRFFDFVSHGLNRDNILSWLGGDVSTIVNWHEQYNLEIFKLGARHQVEVIDISTIFFEQRNLGDYYCIDGMHPNERGHDLITQVLLQSTL